jgi:hypothetical protein
MKALLVSMNVALKSPDTPGSVSNSINRVTVAAFLHPKT